MEFAAYLGTQHERDLARPGVYLPAAVRMGATTINQGGGPFSYSGTEPRSGMIQWELKMLAHLIKSPLVLLGGLTNEIEMYLRFNV